MAILTPAIIGLVFVNELLAWDSTPWLLCGAGSLLGLLPAFVIIYVGWKAVHSAKILPVVTLLALASPALASEPGKPTSPPTRTLIRSVPAGSVYAYGNAAGETVEEMENRQGKLISRRFYRPAPPACAYLRSVGLGTGRYGREEVVESFSCISPVKQLGTVPDPLDLGLKNALSYHIDGDAERIHKMLLYLNVNQRHEAKQAHQVLAQAAKRHTQEALHTPLPKAAEQAIAAGKPWRGTVKAATLELVRDDWPTGKGYTLNFIVRPSQ